MNVLATITRTQRLTVEVENIPNGTPTETIRKLLLSEYENFCIDDVLFDDAFAEVDIGEVLTDDATDDKVLLFEERSSELANCLFDFDDLANDYYGDETDEVY
jgi:hypothetical protein